MKLASTKKVNYKLFTKNKLNKNYKNNQIK